MIIYAEDAIYSVREWDSFCSLMAKIRLCRKLSIKYKYADL